MTKQYDICLLPGDGIGPEIIAEGVKVLNAVGAKYETRFDCKESLIGGAAIDAVGDPLPAATLEAAKAADAVLLAAVGGPKWDTTDPGAPRPEAGLLGIRKGLGLYTNLRPVQIFDALAGASTLKPEVIEGVDLMIVRELTGGLYFGKRERFYDEEGAGADGAKGQRAYDTLEYREYEVERIARQAFEAARKRRGKVTSVDKANVLETSRMWREIVHRIGEQEYPDVQIEDLLVDNTGAETTQVYTDSAARAMTNILEGVMKSGTGSRLSLNDMPSAGKTGTTNDNKDGWFVGYTAYYTTAVWAGCDQVRALNGLSGSSYPGTIWNQFMETIHQGLEKKQLND